MRDLTKSTLSAGLAMSLFGVQTAVNLFRGGPAEGSNKTQESLDAVTQTLVEQTGSGLREVFHAGDLVQRELVDLTMQFLTMAPMRPQGGMSMLTDMSRQVGDRMRRWMGKMGDAGGSDCGCGDRAGSMQGDGWTEPQQPDAQPTPPPRSSGASPSGEGGWTGRNRP